MKKMYQAPDGVVCNITTENFIAMSMNDTVGDSGVQLSRRSNGFDDEEDEDYDADSYSSGLWE